MSLLEINNILCNSKLSQIKFNNKIKTYQLIKEQMNTALMYSKGRKKML